MLAGLVVASVVLVVFIGLPVALLRGWRRVAGGLGGLVAFVAVALVAVKLRYGGGAQLADRSTAPVLPASALQPLVTLDFPPGNVAVDGDGRVFFAYHPFAKAERFAPATMFELVGGAPRPYPDAAFQARYQGVFGMTVDRQHRLWLIEPASLDHARTRLLMFDLRTNTVALEHWFPEGEARFAQDLRVSPDGATVYLADTGLFRFTSASLIVFDVATRTHRTVLATAAQAQAQDWVIHTRYGAHKLAWGLVTFEVGLDGIELSPDGAWLTFGAMSNDQLYKVPTAALRDRSTTDAELAHQIVALGPKPLSDGITLDRDGAVVLTDIEHGGLARLDARGALVTLVRSPDVVWADGVVMAPDGALLVTDSAIPAYIDPLGRPPSLERLAAGRPYRIYRVSAPPR
jgi:sugar lactone lactonase YvrE